MKFIILKIKKLFIPVCICIFTVFLVCFSNSNLLAAQNGLSLWANSVVPALFPFFIATELLSYTSIVKYLGKFLEKFMRPLFNVPRGRFFSIYYGYNLWLSHRCKNYIRFKNARYMYKRRMWKINCFYQ